MFTRLDAIKQCEEEYALDSRDSRRPEIITSFFAGRSETLSFALLVSGKILRLSTARLKGFDYIVARIATLALGTGAVTTSTIIAGSSFEKFLLAALHFALLDCEPFFGADRKPIFINSLAHYIGAARTLLIAFKVECVHVETAAGNGKCDIE
jgi:hypothetical protein